MREKCLSTGFTGKQREGVKPLKSGWVSSSAHVLKSRLTCEGASCMPCKCS